MASSASSYPRNKKQDAFSGIEPNGKRRKVDESSRLFDVFINHRGPDVKQTVALQLYNSLTELGIYAFLDSEEKELGDSFPSTIESAIRSASAHIAIFSKGYAESPWCLAELVLMSQSSAKIIPVFYGVKPSALRYIESGEYAKAFTRYEEKGRYMEKLKDWKEALQSVSFLTGHEISSNFSVSECQNIVSAVHKEVQRKEPLHVAKYPVGLDRVVTDFERLCLDKGLEDFQRQCRTKEGGKENAQIIGIFGMGGVGKTTLAKELFNRRQSQYTKACFLFDVREAYANKGFPCLQMKLVKDLYNQDNLNFHCIEEGKSHIERCIRRRQQLSFLLVLDDIDHLEQLDALLIRDMLNKSVNSLVIVTTRDAGVLKNAGTTVTYNLEGMDKNGAKELFCWHGFSQSYPSSGYERLLDLFVEVCGGLPLSLQVLGSHVHGTDQEFWELELEKVNKTLPQDIYNRLKISIDTLDKEEKQIFMDSACFFIGELTKDAIRVWEGSGWSAQHALRRLKDKCLVEEFNDIRKVTASEEIFVLRMHDHLRDLGRVMADELSHPRRLWRSQHLQSLESKGFKSILTQPKFRYLHSFMDRSLGCQVKYFLGQSDITLEPSPTLLWLELAYCSHELTDIPPWIPLQNLQYFMIRDGSLERLWQNNEQEPFALKELRLYRISKLEELSLGLLRRLEVLVIHNCGYLKILRGISDLTKLVELEIVRCGELEKLNLVQLSCLKEISIHACGHLKSVTISDLTKLVKLDIDECGELKELSFVRLNSAEKIRICNCDHLESLTRIPDLKELENFNIGNCGKLEKLSLVQLSCLKEFIIHGCGHLRSVITSDLTKLVKLDIFECGELEQLSFVGCNSAEKIIISDCKHLKCLTGISDLTKLKVLKISNCEEHEKLSLLQLSCLEEIRIYGCDNLKSVTTSDLTRLGKLDIVRCGELEELSLVRLSSLEFCLNSKLTTLKRIELKGCKNLISVDGTFWKFIKLNIYDCPKLEKIPDIEIFHLLERVQILYCSNETIRNYILQMKKLPSNFIKLIGEAVAGAESSLNANLFSDFNSSNSVIQMGTEATWNHLGRHVVGAIILCAVVVVNTSSAAKRMNDLIGECDINPWLKCKVREGQWIITSVTSKQDEIDRHVGNKGNCFPFDYISFSEDAVVKSVTIPVMRGEEHKVLNVLRRIVRDLYQK